MGVLFRSRDLNGTSRRLNAAATPSAISDTTGLPLVRATLPPVSPWSGAMPTPSPIQTMPAAPAGRVVQRMPLAPPLAETNMPHLEPPLPESPAGHGITAAQTAAAQPVSQPGVMRQATAAAPAGGGAAASQSAFASTTQPVVEPTPSLPIAPAVPLSLSSLTAAPSAPVQTSAAAPIVPPTPGMSSAPAVQRQPAVSQAAVTSAPITTVTPPTVPPVMRAAAPEAATTGTTSGASAAPQAAPSSEATPVTGGEPTLDKEWSRLERIMQLHRKKAEEAGAEPGVIPAPPPPAEPTHLQKMEEKQKRIHTPSRMPPPELRRRAEVVTFSPDEAKGKTPTAPSLPTTSSAPMTSAAQRSTAPEPDTTPQPQVSPTQPAIAKPETGMSDMSEAAATPAMTPVQRQTSTAPEIEEPGSARPQAEPTPPPVTPVQRQTPPVSPSAESRMVRPQTGSDEATGTLPATPQFSEEPGLPPAQREPVTPTASESNEQPTAVSQNLQRQVSASLEPSVTKEAADSPEISAAAPPVTPVQRQTEVQAIPPAPETAPDVSAASVVPPVSQPVQRQAAPVTDSAKTTQLETTGSADSPVAPPEPPLAQTVSAIPEPVVEDTAVQAIPAAASSPTVQPVQRLAEQPDLPFPEKTTSQPVQRLAEQPDLPSPEKTTRPAAADTSVPAQPLSPQVQHHSDEQNVPVIRQPEKSTSERLPEPIPALTESTPSVEVTAPAAPVQRQVPPPTPSPMPTAAPPREIETPTPTDTPIAAATRPKPISAPAEPAAFAQRTAAESDVSGKTVALPAAAPPSSPVASGVPDSSVQSVAAPSLGQQTQSESQGETKPTSSVQRREATPTRAETGMAVPLPVVKARPLPEFVMPAISPEATVLPTDVPDGGTSPVQRAAATPSSDITLAALPPAAATPLTPTSSPPVLTTSEAVTTAPSVQRAVEPEPLASPVATHTQPDTSVSDTSELDMPTMIMPATVDSSQPEATRGVATPPPAVQRHIETPPTAQPTPAAPDAAAPEPEPERWSLADVWPVQRKEEPRPAPEHEGVEPAEMAEPMRHDKPEAGQVKQVMRQVAAAKPTDSSVELILPRRQRPTLPPRTPAPAAPPVQTQRESNGGSSKPPAAPPQAFVPTEIGPLPGDLWEILGAPTPAAAPAATAPAPAAPTQTSVMRAIAAAESQPPQPTFRNGDGPHAEAIQRAESAPEQSRPTSTATAGSGVPSRTATAQEGQSGQGTEGGEQGEVNVDELARQVYHEVRRRLSVEWERGRGRF